MATMNRFPLWALFASRGALRMGYNESEAKLLGHSTALLYCILRNRGGGGRKKKTAPPVAVSNEPSDVVQFAGMSFPCERTNGQLTSTLVGGERQVASKFDSDTRYRFRGTYLADLCQAFDAYLLGYSPEELQGQGLYTLYATWRDACKTGFNLVDLDELLVWLKERINANS